MSSKNVESRVQPAEWEKHAACWLAWPWNGELWLENLAPAQEEFIELCRAINADGGESLEILVPDEEHLEIARTALLGLSARFWIIPVGDIWLRDTAPIFVRSVRGGELRAHVFGFNGWGEKYLLKHDDRVGADVARVSELPTTVFPFILEGGSIDVDGQGTALTTKQCLLNPNRNPSLKMLDIEQALRESLGVTKTLWIEQGLLNDHTDGHVDTIARFVAPGVVVCMGASGTNDPNFGVLKRIETELRAFSDAEGRPLKVETVPSPGLVKDEEGRVMPASYVNFYIGNRSVVVPTYGTPFDNAALTAIAKLFPKHRTVGSSARALLSGGGAFHCITQQQPLAKKA